MVQGYEQTKSAQAYAEKLVNDWEGPGTNVFKNCTSDDRQDQGQNLAYNWEPTPAAAVKRATNVWYDKIKDYNFARPGFQKGTGSFTQVLL